jgi:hypothetical protein
MRLRRLITATHRDLGYFFAGLTVIYAVSGIAVNHFIISGTKGLGGRGRWLLLAGLAIPIAYLVWMAW